MVLVNNLTVVVVVEAVNALAVGGANEITVLIGQLSRDDDLVAVEVVGLLAAFTVFGCPIADLGQDGVAVGIGVDIGISAVPNESDFLFEVV